MRHPTRGFTLYNMENMENLSYRPVERSDFEKICQLPQNAEELFFMFPSATYPLTPTQMEANLQSRSDSTVALLEDEVVGFANFYKVVPHSYCSIGNVIVSSRYRKQGIGEFLIRAMEVIGIAEHHAYEFHLSCFNTNTYGLLLYSKLGYRPFETEKWINAANEPFALIKMKRELYIQPVIRS